MDECFKCGAQENRTMLFDAISEKGIVNICKKCASEEDLPIIKKSTFEEYEEKIKLKSLNVYERLTRISDYNSENKKPEKEKTLLKKQETTLKNIVDKNFEKNFKKQATLRNDLIENFHWIIMRARRLKHITQKQLAKAIAEPEAKIKMAEKGVLPENSQQFINKFENYLGIRLIKKREPQSPNIIQREINKEKNDNHSKINFDPITTKIMTISNLKEMEKKKETEILNEKDNETQIKNLEDNYIFNENINLNPEYAEEQLEFINDNENKDKYKEDLSEKDIKDLVFRK